MKICVVHYIGQGTDGKYYFQAGLICVPGMCYSLYLEQYVLFHL